MSETILSSPSVSRTWGAPFETFKRKQATLTGRRLYPLTVFYTLYGIVVLHIAFSTTHPWIAVTFFFAGCVVWILTEYLFYRFVQHGCFPTDEGIIRGSLHGRMNPLHWEHQRRPFDAKHIGGGLKDAPPLFFLAGPISVFFPFYITPVLLAGVLESYVAEEWLHYALRFSKSRVPLIRRMKKYHFYHCRLKGIDRGYGITALRHRSSEYREHAANSHSGMTRRLSGRRNSDSVHTTPFRLSPDTLATSLNWERVQLCRTGSPVSWNQVWRSVVLPAIACSFCEKRRHVNSGHGWRV